MTAPVLAPEAHPADLTPPEDDDLRLLLTVRHFEKELLRLFGAGLLNGTTHTCLGQEYVPVALRTLIGPDDFVFSNHRGHGHYLARYDDPRGLLAEIMGRQGAVCDGVGGSQHILRGRYLSTGVQGQSLPVAAGVALRLKHTEPGRLACVHIGDGTWGEGAVYEALNMAALWRLPLLVVVENNGIAQSTPTAMEMAGTIADRARAFGIDHQRVDTVDVAAIRDRLGPAIARVRAEHRPLVVEFVTHRVGPHSKGDDTRRPEEIERARQHDWYPRYRAAFPERFAAWDERTRALVAQVSAEVRELPPAVWTERTERTER
ncbi:thiamine pyrophosphate-dependent dehydrogenase E1 component subunit alpha [Streptantibioticus cattleyicolor]|uniref:Dehydrogenase E1 component n=1 Tax=Streptantibioticus cattleyicolor (strain ATCC 35852 / DSM 46488 / JCM 4925 / NBRC 14057 / NRRL 8057) TaxID=1003195 RepID=F8JKR4_STREN|nr:thiamine pyrophosphate-dependent dehydrogenase E1 component subunit alpha [Streptantibioticus cattleyicolor]AEW98443.1 dehydrogenase E1 component [Streptantibioticus cattleyicolor NRRL 8057 = DSM 46488]CCB72502.1 Pyruvate/2-oxoglutarate dehydrogenase complex, dehydrogenase component alpha subunit [Streptantibioticus cattleyicolor NRRL 8057 = DSM 46488]